MADPTPGPLVPKKYAVALAAAGVVLCAGARLLPPDFRDLGVVVSYLLCAAGGHEWRQPAWFKARPMVSQPVALAFGGMAAGAYDWAQSSGTPLAHLLGLTLSAAAGVVTQPTLGLKNGATGRETLRLVPLLLLAGSLQGCAHKAASGPPAHEAAALLPEPAPAPEAQPEPATACKRLDDARLFWGVWAKVCGTLSGGAAAGTVATTGDPQKAVGLSGLGLLACAVATGYLETELAVRHTRQCSR